MKNIVTTFLLTSLLLAGYSQTKVKLIDSLFTTLHLENRFSGNALIVDNGQPVYQKSFGFADRDKQLELDESALFNTGGLSMAITAVAVLQLGEKGMLDVDEPVGKYISGFPYESMTVGHLLTHASGLPEIEDLLPDWDQSKLIRNSDVMEALYKQKPELAFKPGSGSMYNNVGYVILAEMVRVISRQDFSEYLKNNVFYPAGMESTAVYNGQNIENVEKAAKGYYFSPFTRTWVEALKSSDFGKLYSLTGTEGNSNVWSTTTDLILFCQAISKGSILNEKSVSSMFLKKTDALRPGQSRSYGNSFSYGWVIPEAPFRIAMASGNMPGFNAEIVWNLSEKRMIIFLSNDYLSFTSYNNLLPYAVGTIINQDSLMIPLRYASIELTNEVMHISGNEIVEKLAMMKDDTDHYIFDTAGLEYLVDRLRDRGETAKADLIAEQLNP